MNKAELKEVNSWSEVPEFESIEQEREFWQSHSFGKGLRGPEFVDDPLLPPVRARATPVSLRFDVDTVKRLKALAARRNKGYQTMVKEFVAERLYEEEKREGIIGETRAS